jgi:hypothetical protein
MTRPQCDTPLVGMGTRTQTMITMILFFLKTGPGYFGKKVDFKKKG